MLSWKPPSPAINTTGLPATANAAPIAAGSANPIAPMPPDVRNRWSVAQLERLRRPHLVLADVRDERGGRGRAGVAH